jgi:signal transduction histidine kinase
VSTKPRWGLSSWLALLVLGAVFPLVLFASTTLRGLFQASRAATERGQVDTTRALALVVDGEVRAWRAALRALGESLELRGEHLGAFEIEARAVATQHNGWLVINDATGRQFMNTLLPAGAPLPKSTALDMVQAVFRDGKPVTDMVFGAAANRYIISNSIPVFRDGKVVLCLSLNFGPERLNQLLESQQFPATWFAAIIDSQQRVVARSRDAEARVGKPIVEWFSAATRATESGVVTGPMSDSRLAQIAFRRLHEVPWIVTFAVPVEELGSAAPIWRFVIMGAIVGAAAVGMAVYTGRKVTAPVRRLAQSSAQLLRGEVDDLAVSSGIREVYELQEAMAQAAAAARAHAQEREQAAEALREANEALEARVEERTAILAKTNHALQAAIASLEDANEQRIQAEVEVRSLAKFPSENPNPVLRLASDGRILYANVASEALLRLWGCAVGQKAPAPWPETARQALASRRQTSVDLVCGDRTYAVFVVPVADAGYVNLYMADITERKRAAEALRESREDLNRAQAVAYTGSWRLDTRRNALTWSDETYRTFGITRGTPLTYETFLGAVHPLDRHHVDEHWKAALAGKPYDIEHRIVVGDAVKWVREKAELEFDETGALLGGFGTVQDITDRKVAELALRDALATMESRLEERTVEPMASQPVNAKGVIPGSSNIGALGQDVSRRAAEIVALDRIAEVLGSSLDLEVILPALLAEVRRLLEAEAAWVLLLDPGQDTLGLVAVNGVAAESLRGTRVPVSDSLARQVLQTRNAILVNDVAQDPRVPASLRARIGEHIRSLIFVPLLCKGRAIGILAAANRSSGPFVPEHVRTLSLIASTTAVAVDNAHMFDEAQRSQDRLARMSRRLVEVQEEERRAIARELHDEVGQSLTALRLMLGMATSGSTPQQDGRWAEAQGMVAGLLSQVRELSLDLRPAVLDDLGLLPALLWHTERFQRQTGLRVTLEHACVEGRRFAATLETAVFRTVQEALTNVVRHARVQEATVRVWTDDTTLGANVEDQGVGFDAEATLNTHRSTGLSGIRERAALLGGVLTIESQPGSGTRILVEFPLSERAPARNDS